MAKILAFCSMLTLAFGINVNVANAQFSDDFDTYANGQTLIGVNGWKGWFNNPAVAGRASSTFSNSAPNSIEILNNNDRGTGPSTDAVNTLNGPYTSRKWSFTCEQFIPSGGQGTQYFILLNNYNDQNQNMGWSTQLEFNLATGIARDFNNGGGLMTTLVVDQWVPIRIEIDLDNDTCQEFYNHVLLYQGSWSDRQAGGADLVQISALDLYGGDDLPGQHLEGPAYYDNLELSRIPAGGFVPAASFTQFRGVLVSGGLADIQASDNMYLKYKPGFVLNSMEAPVWLVFGANAPTAVDFLVESQAGTPGLTYTVEAWNWNALAYDQLGTQGEMFNSDVTTTFPIVDANHIDDNGNVRGRVGWRKTGFTINYPWEVRIDLIGWNVRVGQDAWMQIPVDFGAVKTVAYEQSGDYLYSGTVAAGGGAVWRSPDGLTWKQVSPNGFGDPQNISASPGVEFKGQVYAGTTNANTGGQIWRSADGVNWTQVNISGFGDPNNLTVTPNEEFDGFLYAGTDNQTTGAQVWRTADGTNWVQVVDDGFGDPNTVQIEPNLVFGGFLYAAATNLTGGGKILRSADGVVWNQANIDGFGDPNNISAIPSVVFANQIYAGTANLVTGAQIWRSADGTTWTPVISDGFGDSNNTVMFVGGVFAGRVFAGTLNQVTGGEVWSSVNGVDWLQSNVNGFGDPNNILTIPTAVFNNLLFTSVQNNLAGGQLWVISDPPPSP